MQTNVAAGVSRRTIIARHICTTKFATANGFFMLPLWSFFVAAGVSRRTNLCRLTAAATWMEGRLPRRPENKVAANVSWRTVIARQTLTTKFGMANGFFMPLLRFFL